MYKHTRVLTRTLLLHLSLALYARSRYFSAPALSEYIRVIETDDFLSRYGEHWRPEQRVGFCFNRQAENNKHFQRSKSVGRAAAGSADDDHYDSEIECTFRRGQPSTDYWDMIFRQLNHQQPEGNKGESDNHADAKGGGGEGKAGFTSYQHYSLTPSAQLDSDKYTQELKDYYQSSFPAFAFPVITLPVCAYT